MSQQGLVTRQSGAMSITTEERKDAHEALDKMMDGGIVASTHDPNIAAALMEYAQKRHILLTEALGAFRLRPGWELAFTKLPVNTSKEARLVYKVNDDDNDRSRDWSDGTLLAFHKPLLYMIRTHLGMNITDKIRVDDKTSPLCFEYKAHAKYLGIDGQERTLVAMGGLDLRDGSPAAQKVLDEGRGNNAEERRRNGEKNLSRMRTKVMQRADTNVEERVIQSYGFRGSYTKGELDSKLIVCVRPIRTGYHPNPEIQKMLIQQMMQEDMMAKGLLYGNAPPAPPLPPSIITEGLYLPAPASEASPSAGEAGAGQGEGAAAAVASVEGDSDANRCTPESCYGKASSGHVPACYGTLKPSQPTQTQNAPAAEEVEPWKITRGQARGLAVTSNKVRPETLIELRNYYITELDPNGPDFTEMSDEKKDLLSGEMKEVVRELRRRGIKDDGE